MEAEREMVVSRSLENAIVKEREMKFDFMKNPHQHPLIFYRQGRPNGGRGQVQKIFCSICGQSFRPPAFGCSKDYCNFHVHQSCIELPSKIPNPFHTFDDGQTDTHSLLRTPNSNYPCHYCGQNPYGDSYICWYRGYRFVLDLPCVIDYQKASNNSLKTATTGGGDGGEIRHFSHPHPLTLQTDLDKRNTISFCIVCQRSITSPSTYYSCSQSLSNCHSYTFHPQCAELPLQILNLDLHPHPLFLFALPWRDSILCRTCKSECTNFFYSCPPCDFMNLHVDCVSSYNHKHDFCILRHKLSYNCQVCGMSDTSSFPWFCTVCLLFAHKKCAILKMSKHHHHGSTQTSNSIIQEKEIQHFSHKQHKLTLCQPNKDMHCDGCMRRISTDLSQSYACQPCGFYLHQECATLPTRHKNFVVHPHDLSLVYIPDFVFSCAVCLQYCHGFAYNCKKCYYAIDIRCAAITFPFTHSTHPHPLNYYDGKGKHKCVACGKGLKTEKTVGCEECNFYLDVRCAHLPLAVRNRFDEHPLILTFGNEDENSNEYYCDVCEKERNINEWFYNCRLCCFAAHPNCVFGDYPFLKSAQFESHMHPLSLVNECKRRYSTCAACEKSCDGQLTFKCGSSMCKFNVHAFGHCYHIQLTKGRITFTMPSLHYHSISLHLDPDEIKWWKLISFNNMEVEAKDEHSPTLSFKPQGGQRGIDWDDGVFSTIKALRIYILVERNIGAVQIEYEDKYGNSIWKDKHGNKINLDTEVIEVTLNHPDEYLISIHGYYDNNGIIQSLTFETNQRTLGPYGSNKYDGLFKFSFPTKGEKIVGLHGRSNDDFLFAVGFHFVSIPKVD